MKKILVLGPILADWTEIQVIANTMTFLETNYEVEFIDPLQDIISDVEKKTFFKHWKCRLETLTPSYDAFFGFSLGGVILQQSFDLFENQKKPIVLFSVPSFADEILAERLNAVIYLIHQKSIESAIAAKNEWVFFPALPPKQTKRILDPIHAGFRLSYGLECVLKIDSRPMLKKPVNYLHFIGEQSKLVNRNNIVSLPNKLIEVPHAGMRVLTDNPDFCIPPLLQFFEKNIQ